MFIPDVIQKETGFNLSERDSQPADASTNFNTIRKLKLS